MMISEDAAVLDDGEQATTPTPQTLARWQEAKRWLASVLEHGRRASLRDCEPNDCLVESGAPPLVCRLKRAAAYAPHPDGCRRCFLTDAALRDKLIEFRKRQEQAVREKDAALG